MSFTIGKECIDVLDKACMDVCPVDCIYTGSRKNYINTSECINCGACLSVCPVDAIYTERDVDGDPDRLAFVRDSQRFFEEPLPGLDVAVGDPGGSMLRGDIGVDTDLVAAFVKD